MIELQETWRCNLRIPFSQCWGGNKILNPKPLNPKPPKILVVLRFYQGAIPFASAEAKLASEEVCYIGVI